MKALILAFALAPLTASAATVNITGAAARELYDRLDIQAVPVIEEHTGLTTAIAKYGKTFGCERDLAGDSTYCWFTN